MGHSDTHRSLHELFNQRRLEEIEAHVAPGFMYEDLPRMLTIKTPGEYTDWLRAWVAAFSDGQISTAQYVDGPDFSVATYHGRGTNDGPLGPMPPTGLSADVPFCEILHYASDGKILSGEVYYDQLSLLTQLGHVTPPGMTHDSVEPVVRRLFEVFDSLDLDAARDLITDDAQGVDEISRRWLRGTDEMLGHFESLKDSVSDVRSELSDIRESISGDTAIVTMNLEQDYTFQGSREHVSAPTTVALRRTGGEWKICLIHTVALEQPAED